MNKKRIGLVGYYGFGNYGDEYFREVLQNEFEDFELVLLHGFTPEGDLDLGEIAERVQTVDAILIGGGDLVIPYAWSSLYWRDEYLHKPVYIYGVGVPRWGGYNPEVVKKTREFFMSPSVRSIVARDQEGADWIAKYLTPRVPVACKPDIVCAFQSRPVAKVPGRIGLVLRAQGSGLTEQRIRWLADTVAKTGHAPRLIVLGTDKTARDDLASLATLAWGDGDIVMRDDLQKLTDELLSCEKVISMKFHGCVVAMAHNVPCLALSGANKFKNFYASLDKNDWITTLAAEGFEDIVRNFLKADGYAFPDSVKLAAKQGLRELHDQLASVSGAGPVPETDDAL